MLNIWLIRHAESEANAGLVTAHPATSALTARGRAQAEHIPRAFNERPALIVTSPYIRTKQTAQPTIERFADVPQEEWLIQEFTFLAPINYKNTSYVERRPMVESFWNRCDPAHVDGERAESFAEGMASHCGKMRIFYSFNLCVFALNMGIFGAGEFLEEQNPENRATLNF